MHATDNIGLLLSAVHPPTQVGPRVQCSPAMRRTTFAADVLVPPSHPRRVAAVCAVVQSLCMVYAVVLLQMASTYPTVQLLSWMYDAAGIFPSAEVRAAGAPARLIDFDATVVLFAAWHMVGPACLPVVVLFSGVDIHTVDAVLTQSSTTCWASSGRWWWPCPCGLRPSV